MDGAVETGLDDNDVLDVPVWRDSPPKIRGYDVLVVDEVSAPIGGVTPQFTFDNPAHIPFANSTSQESFIVVVPVVTASRIGVPCLPHDDRADWPMLDQARGQTQHVRSAPIKRLSGVDPVSRTG